MLPSLILCTIVGISDGDTLTARCANEDQLQTVKVRLAEIDAPEKRQPFGQRSKQHLSATCFGKQAEVKPTMRDRYGRTVAHVRCDDVDANAEQVRAGMAWVFIRYAAKKSPLFAIESEARQERRGLWVGPAPVPPWEWRRDH